MPTPFHTPQEVEDAFYDALDERNTELMMRVWDDTPDIACLLPMQPMVHGGEVRNLFKALLGGETRINIQVSHVHWVQIGDVAIHYVQERADPSGVRPPASGERGGGVPPLYATNIYRRRGEAGWSMILHQNSPPAPPAGMPPPR
ncbi:MAG: ketosteroid isomerase [Chromatiaceae bacterium]|nr:MAG: ketosteroid isomerase [Chromatiaceae bacterium]